MSDEQKEQWTPGQWKSRDTLGTADDRTGVWTDKNREIANCGPVPSAGSSAEWRRKCEENIANARVCAASKDLYRELKRLEWRKADGGFRFCPVCTGDERDGHTIDCTLSAALRKARGEA